MPPKPQFDESFESFEAYLEALIEWKLDRRFEAIKLAEMRLAISVLGEQISTASVKAE